MTTTSTTNSTPDPGPRRLGVVLPASSGRQAVLRGCAVRVTSRPQRCPVDVLDLVVASGDDWRVGDAQTGSVTWIPPSVGSPTATQLSRLLRGGEVRAGVVQVAQDLRLEVEYAGPLSASAFAAAAVGSAPGIAPPAAPGSRAARRGLSRFRATPGQTTSGRILLDPAARPGQHEFGLDDPTIVEAVLVDDAESWVVEDLRLDGVSWATQAGEFPARALSTLRDLGLVLGVAWRSVEIWATYVGPDEDGRALEVELLSSRPSVFDEAGRP